MPSARRELSPIVEGIAFTFEHAGRAVRGLVTSEALESAFGAPSAPAGWLQCFDEHSSAIVEAARVKYLRRPQLEPVLVRSLQAEPAEPG